MATISKKQKSKSLKETAYHEAGHALACLLVNRNFIYVTIKPGGDALGHVKRRQNCLKLKDFNEVGGEIFLKTILDPDRLTYFFIEDFISIAGGIAETICVAIQGFKNKREVVKDLVTRASNDLINMHAINFGEGSLLEKYQSFINEYAVRVFMKKENISKLKVIAGALLEKETLRYNDVINLIHK